MEAPTFLLLVLCVGVAASSAVDLHKRIHGGKECDPTERLYHVRLIPEDAQGKKYVCGGSLISDQWVLTAAHCKDNMIKIYAIPGVHPGPGKPVEIIKYVPFTDPSHDIMLLKLPHPVKNPQITLPTKGNCKTLRPLPIGETVNIAGHGTNTVNANGIKVGESDKLLCVDMHVVDCNFGGRKCLNMDPQYLFCAGNNQDKKEGKDVGPGDSGSGVVYKGLLHGIVKGGKMTLCAGPAIFVDVCPHLEWILKTIKK